MEPMDRKVYHVYTTCTWCGFKKYCREDGRMSVCYACDLKHRDKRDNK